MLVLFFYIHHTTKTEDAVDVVGRRWIVVAVGSYTQAVCNVVPITAPQNTAIKTTVIPILAPFPNIT